MPFKCDEVLFLFFARIRIRVYTGARIQGTEVDGKRAILRSVLSCLRARATRYFQPSLSIIDMIDGARETRGSRNKRP